MCVHIYVRADVHACKMYMRAHAQRPEDNLGRPSLDAARGFCDIERSSDFSVTVVTHHNQRQLKGERKKRPFYQGDKMWRQMAGVAAGAGGLEIAHILKHKAEGVGLGKGETRDVGQIPRKRSTYVRNFQKSKFKTLL